MKLLCRVCGKEFEALRSTKTTCSDGCRQKLARGKVTVTRIVPVIVTGEKVTVTKPLTVTDTVTKEFDIRTLVFSKESIGERIKKYKSFFPDCTFVPNWIAHGFNSQEEAIRAVINSVEGRAAKWEE